MQQRPFGSTGQQVGVIGQGTWYIDAAHRTSALAALRRGLDLGMNHIDTAEMYGSGASEEVIAEAIAGRRDEVFLVSKVLPSNASSAGLRKACERSLRHLRTDRLDCYLLHWRGSYPLEETFSAFEALRKEGKILSFGVSNFDVDDLEEAASLLNARQLSCNQVLYHLKERAIEHAVIPWCEKHRVSVTAYSPFGHNNLPREGSAGGAVLAGIASTHGATPHQVALAFLTRNPCDITIPKATRMPHVEENAGAGALSLSADEIAEIDAAFPRGAPKRSLPML